MKIQELFEGKLRQGRYEYEGDLPTPQDRGLVAMYNFVIPALSRIFGMPEANFRVHTDYGLLHYAPKNILCSAEKGLMRVKLRKKDLDHVDFMVQILPKALYNELSKHLTDVQVSKARYIPSGVRYGGGRVEPDLLNITFSSKYPQEWLTPTK
ncbi:MAG: hypothetical protein DDT31_00682 [Syntrophomonadaceae bacterium]|nr:hypothetical protein [Bacillota bacterium]